MSWYRYGWKPYVPVARRRAQATSRIERLRKEGVEIRPVEIGGKKIARTFWGSAWCDHLAKFADYSNRLPRGRTYVRNGSVCHLDVTTGRVAAIVSGSNLYDVEITIAELPRSRWNDIKRRSAGRIGSLLDLLQGRLSEAVLEVVTDRDRGIFPSPGDIRATCTCPDWATMCKHIAAVLYGVGARLDEAPELLFRLRGVDHQDLLAIDAAAAANVATRDPDLSTAIPESQLGELFGIEIADTSPPKPPPKSPPRRRRPPRREALRDERRAPSPSGPETLRLRTEFDMTREEFARILGVSVPTLARWEGIPGPLALRSRSLEAWIRVAAYTERDAWKRHWEAY